MARGNAKPGGSSAGKPSRKRSRVEASSSSRVSKGKALSSKFLFEYLAQPSARKMNILPYLRCKVFFSVLGRGFNSLFKEIESIKDIDCCLEILQNLHASLVDKKIDLTAENCAKDLVISLVRIVAKCFGNPRDSDKFLELFNKIIDEVIIQAESVVTRWDVLYLLVPNPVFALEYILREPGKWDDIYFTLSCFIRSLLSRIAQVDEPSVAPIIPVLKAMDERGQCLFASYVVENAVVGVRQMRLLAVDLIPYFLDLFYQNDNLCLQCLKPLVECCFDATYEVGALALTNLAQQVEHREQLRDLARSLMVDKLTSCKDKEAEVREGIILVTSKMITFLEVDGDYLQVLGKACFDPLARIREAAILALSEAFRKFPEWRIVVKEWLRSVPCQVAVINNSTAIHDECKNLFLELVLDRISKDESSISMLILEELCAEEVRPKVRKICKSLGRKEKLKPDILIALQEILRTSEYQWLSTSMSIEMWTSPPGAWFLLAELSPYHPKAMDLPLLFHHNEVINQSLAHDPEEGQYAARALHSACKGPSLQLVQGLLKCLEEFNIHPYEVDGYVRACKHLIKGEAWVKSLIGKASRTLESYMSKSDEEQKQMASDNKILLEAITAVHTIGCLCSVDYRSVDYRSADILSVHSNLKKIITSGSSNNTGVKKQAKYSVSIKQPAPSLYSVAWLTLGKMCLINVKLAKDYLPVFVKELGKSDCVDVWENTATGITEIFIKFNDIVSMPTITTCLHHPCERVRRKTFIALSKHLKKVQSKEKRKELFLQLFSSVANEFKAEKQQLTGFLYRNISKGEANSILVEDGSGLSLGEDLNPDPDDADDKNERDAADDAYGATEGARR